MQKVVKYVIVDIMRNRVMMTYTIALLIISFSVFNLEGDPSKGLLTLLNVLLIILPLVSIVFSTIYIFNASEFIELLLAQPIRRTRLFLSIYIGLSSSLILAFLIGVGVPLLLYVYSFTGIVMLLSGIALTAIFVSLALLAFVATRDKTKGIGLSIMLWFFFSLIYDGLLLFIVFQFSDYPLEKAMIALSSLNPIDLGRILILLRLDVAALMGYTGAVFQKFFGSGAGTVYSSAVMLLWIAIPLVIATVKFRRQDL